MKMSVVLALTSATSYVVRAAPQHIMPTAQATVSHGIQQISSPSNASTATVSACSEPSGGPSRRLVLLVLLPPAEAQLSLPKHKGMTAMIAQHCLITVILAVA